MKKILITGITGFVGKNLAIYLAEYFEVSCILRKEEAAELTNRILFKYCLSLKKIRQILFYEFKFLFLETFFTFVLYTNQ
jgi:nucleoside-diphosphate-sugar epimerase